MRSIPSGPPRCFTVPLFWSDWDTDRIQFVGVPGADEVRPVIGSPTEREFLALYRRDEQLTGALGLNLPRPVMRMRALIARQASWSEAVEFAQAGSTRATPRDTTPSRRERRSRSA